VEDALQRAQELLALYEGELRGELPDGADIYDAHVHLGDDIDGMAGRFDELMTGMERYGVSRANMFCLDEPDRHPAFRAANDRTLAFAERSSGRLVPFVRLDLTEEPLEEARRCLDLGARGIKLHPRAQRFQLNDERLSPIFAIAAERNVPILIHGGRGLPPIAAELRRLVEAHPGSQLIIAHAGIADLGNLAACFAGKRGVFFDTSVWSAVDLLDFLHLVPPEQVVYASDYPYGRQPNSLLLALRTARIAGFSEEEVRNLLAGNAHRIANGEEPLEPSEPRGRATFSQPMVLARIHQYLSMATPLLWTRQPDTIGVLGLALNATEERNGHIPEVDQIRDLLITARELWRGLPESETEDDRIEASRAVFRLVHLADILSITTDAADG
jgi:predicted TIM-barrel fold metal-dependent hydrolase